MTDHPETALARHARGFVLSRAGAVTITAFCLIQMTAGLAVIAALGV